MTKKYLIAMAKAIKATIPKESRKEFLKELNVILKQSNKNFNKQKFEDACFDS